METINLSGYIVVNGESYQVSPKVSYADLVQGLSPETIDILLSWYGTIYKSWNDLQMAKIPDFEKKNQILIALSKCPKIYGERT